MAIKLTPKYAAIAAAKKAAALVNAAPPPMSALPITNNLLATVLGPGQVLIPKPGQIQIGDTIIDGVTGQVYSLKDQEIAKQLNACASGDCKYIPDVIASTTLGGGGTIMSASEYAKSSLAAADGSFFEFNAVKTDGFTLAVAAFAAWYFFLRGK